MIVTNKQLAAECLKMADSETPLARQSGGITYHSGKNGYVPGDRVGYIQKNLQYYGQSHHGFMTRRYWI